MLVVPNGLLFVIRNKVLLDGLANANGEYETKLPH